jgi:hypothetical protein
VSARTIRPAVAVLVVAAVVVALVVWKHQRCDDDPYASYCAAVAEHRGLIGAATQEGATTGLIAALPSFQALRAKAPADVADDWATLIDAVDGLVDALHAAGVDPASYDRAHPPASLSPQQRDAIDAAATRLGSPETRAALASVDQEARDVCHSPLVL